jgi:hypothetical protein
LDEVEKRAVVYYVNVRIMPRAPLPTTHESASQVAQITVQVARNPNHLSLPLASTDPSNIDEPERNLIAAGRVPLFTYAALVGKNQGR